MRWHSQEPGKRIIPAPFVVESTDFADTDARKFGVDRNFRVLNVRTNWVGYISRDKWDTSERCKARGVDYRLISHVAARVYLTLRRTASGNLVPKRAKNGLLLTDAREG